jgi:hypothetical protein
MKSILNVIQIFTLAIVLVSCSDFQGDIVKDNLATIPVTFSGTTTAGFNPYYTVSFKTDTFSLRIQIPADAKLKIKEITKMVAGTTSITVASLDGTAGQYFAAPVELNGVTTYKLSTSVTEFNTKVTGTTKITAPAAGAFNERAFMIRLTMDDGSLIVPVQVRIRVFQ